MKQQAREKKEGRKRKRPRNRETKINVQGGSGIERIGDVGCTQGKSVGNRNGYKKKREKKNPQSRSVAFFNFFVTGVLLFDFPVD